MKTIEIVNAYNALNGAKLAKMEDKDKFTLIKAMKALKPVKTGYDDFVKDAQEKLKEEDHEEWVKRAQAWRDKHGEEKPGDMSAEDVREVKAINEYFDKYNKRVTECVKEEADKDAAPEYGKLTEEAFGKLLASNEDWDAEKALLVSEVLCE